MIKHKTSLSFIFISVPPRCYNKDFEAVPDYLTHQYVKTYENGTVEPFPFNITVNGNICNLFKILENKWSPCCSF